MGLRPKTARRLALIGGLLLIMVIGGVAALTIPGMQRKRNIESFRSDGLAAHESGDHARAESLLGKYTRFIGESQADPEAMLALARSRAAFDAPRREHFKVAASYYRAYLRRVPDDQAAQKELVRVLAEAGLWEQVVEQANRMRDSSIPGLPRSEIRALTAEERAEAARLRIESVRSASMDDADLLRDELRARVLIDPEDPMAVAIESRLLAEPEVAFVDAWRAFNRASQLSGGRPSVPDRIAEAYNSASPDDLGMQALKIWLDPIRNGEDLRVDNVIEPFMALFEYDPETGLVGRPPDDIHLARAVINSFDVNGRTEVAADFTRAAGERTGDADLIAQHALRRYLLGDFDGLFEIEVPEARRAELADVVGYQAMAAAVLGDSERAGELQRELESISQQFEAQSWLQGLEAHRAIESGDLVAARSALTKAIERHTFEPVMPVMLGRVYLRMGFPADALGAWRQATARSKPIVWTEPYELRVSTLFATDRGLEADDLINEALSEAGYRQNATMLIVRTDVSARLARAGRLGREATVNAIALGSWVRQHTQPGPIRANLDLSLGTLYGAIGLLDEARNSLTAAVADAPGGEMTLRAFEIDRRFGLGLSDSMGMPTLPDRFENPEQALSVAMTYAVTGDPGERVPEAMGVILTGVTNASPADRPAWLLAEAKFRSEFEIDGAREAWEAAIAADPDNAETLIASVESDTYIHDLAYVESVIERVRELTASDGRTLSARLRLARARATLGPKPDREARDAAIAITRAVVAAEPRNIVARRILAGMLALEPDESIAAEKRFTPDYPGAIEQYKTLASQIDGIESVGYLLEVVKLARLRNDQTEAQDALEEVAFRASDNDAIAIRFAQELQKLGDFQSSAEMLSDLFERSTGQTRTSVGLLLAQTYDSVGDSASSREVLTAMAESGSLGSGELNELVARMHLLGLKDEAAELVADAARFGLDEGEQAVVRAQYATRFGSPESAERMLEELVAVQPHNIQAWELLTGLLQGQGRFEDAAGAARRALAHHPDDSNLQYIVLLADGDTGGATRSYFDSLIEQSADENSELADRREDLIRQKQAFDAIEAFESERSAMSGQAQIERLREIHERFVRMPIALRYTLAERYSLGEAPDSLYRDASAAARRHVGDAGILKYAARSALDADRPSDAAEFAAAWRGVAEGLRLEPDLYAAEAARAMDQHERALAILDPYLSEAFEIPDDVLNRQVLLFYGASEIEVRGESAARARLEPLVGRSLGFRSTVWLDLAVTGTSTPEQAETWLDIADQAGLDDYLTRLASVWLRLADRFESRRADFYKRAIEVAERAEQSDANDAVAVVVQAFAMRALGDIEPDAGWFFNAEQRYLRALELEPQNPQHLFDAAMSAASDGRPDDAATHYRALLADDRVTGLYEAGIRNNLAAQLTWGDRSPAELEEALSLANAAVEFRPLDAFLGTRGWIHYARGDFEAAQADFEAVIQSDPASFEGYAGLAATLRALPDADDGAAERAWQRALAVRDNTIPSDPIANVLSRSGFEID